MSASTPVPPDRAVKVRSDADLMFLAAHGSIMHSVYFGRSPGQLEKIGRLSKSNIISPGPLQPSSVYYWRVDAEINERIIRGPVWSFTSR